MAGNESHRPGRGPANVPSTFWSSETVVGVALALVVGLGTGLGIVAFVRMIGLCHALLLGNLGLRTGLGGLLVIAVPALGGLLVGPLVHFVAPEASGHGVPEVLAAIATQGGRIRPIVVLAKAVASAITIGSGGSMGIQGPIVQIGAAFGSTVGQVCRLGEGRLVGLVAAGAAAGMAAAFNAPIAGVIFALEVIVGDMAVRPFSTIVIAAVTASVVSRSALGNHPAFTVPAYTLKSPYEFLLYVGLGLAAGLGAALFGTALHRMEDAFGRLRLPPYLKPAAGGLALGLLGFFLPQIFGTGFDVINDALAGRLAFTLLVVLVFGKVLATSLTLGSGASGGIFAPSLFIGAVLGGAYGRAAYALFPTFTAPSGAYATVGMAALFAGVARAPLTAIVILFEMTQDYRIVLPLMFATVISTIVAQRLEAEGVYTYRLKRRGIDVRAERDRNLMRDILVREAMTPLNSDSTVAPSLPVAELAHRFHETGRHGYVVVDEHGELLGVVTLADLEEAVGTGRMQGTAGDICTHNVITAFPDETLEDALRHFGALDVGRIPVVDRGNPRRVLGVLQRGDVVHAYAHALADRHHREHHIARLRLEASTGARLVEIDVAHEDAVVGKRLRELGVPKECVIVTIRRGGRVVVPRGDTELLADDCVIALADEQAEAALRQALHDGQPQT